MPIPLKYIMYLVCYSIIGPINYIYFIGMILSYSKVPFIY